MALALTVEKIDSVPEAMRSAYVEKDGKFHLDVDGIEDTTGLKNSLTALRGEKTALETAIRSWSKLGKKPEEVEAMLEAERQKSQDALLKAGKFDEVLATHLGNAKTERDAAVEAATKREKNALGIARNALVNTGLANALTKAKASAEGMAALPKLIGDRVKVEFNDANEAVHTILDADGKTPMVGSGTGGLATYDDLVKAVTKDFPSLFEGTGGGGGANNNNRKVGEKTISRADFEALGPLDRAVKIKDGFKLVD